MGTSCTKDHHPQDDEDTHVHWEAMDDGQGNASAPPSPQMHGDLLVTDSSCTSRPERRPCATHDVEEVKDAVQVRRKQQLLTPLASLEVAHSSGRTYDDLHPAASSAHADAHHPPNPLVVPAPLGLGLGGASKKNISRASSKRRSDGFVSVCASVRAPHSDEGQSRRTSPSSTSHKAVCHTSLSEVGGTTSFTSGTTSSLSLKRSRRLEERSVRFAGTAVRMVQPSTVVLEEGQYLTEISHGLLKRMCSHVSPHSIGSSSQEEFDGLQSTIGSCGILQVISAHSSPSTTRTSSPVVHDSGARGGAGACPLSPSYRSLDMQFVRSGAAQLVPAL